MQLEGSDLDFFHARSLLQDLRRAYGVSYFNLLCGPDKHCFFLGQANCLGAFAIVFHALYLLLGNLKEVSITLGLNFLMVLGGLNKAIVLSANDLGLFEIALLNDGNLLAHKFLFLPYLDSLKRVQLSGPLFSVLVDLLGERLRLSNPRERSGFLATQVLDARLK